MALLKGKEHCTKKFSIKDFFNSEQIRRKLRICSHLLKKSLMENFIFCAVEMVFKALESEICQAAMINILR